MEWINTITACSSATAWLAAEAAAGSPLAVDLEGIFEDTGAESELCVVQVAAKAGPTFLFDITTLGSLAFSDDAGGLRHLLENRKIVKLLFDARLDADVLHRQYGVALVNVHDLQILCSCTSEISQYLTGMARIFDRLTLLPAALRARISEVKRLGREYFDPDAGGSLHIWRARPLPHALQIYAAVDTKVLFLIEQQWQDALCADQLKHLSRRRLQLAVRHQQMSAIRDFPLPMERRTLFIAVLTHDCGEEGLRDHFKYFGALEQVHLEGIPETFRARRACVVFADNCSVIAALDAGEKQVTPCGARLVVDRPDFVKDLIENYYGAPGRDEQMWDVPFGDGFGAGWAPLDWSSLPRLPQEAASEDTCSTTTEEEEDEKTDETSDASIGDWTHVLHEPLEPEVAEVSEISEIGETSTAASEPPRKKKSRKQHWLERRRQRRQAPDLCAAPAADANACHSGQVRRAKAKNPTKVGKWVAVATSAEASSAASH